ncbi:hypothetical protein ACFORG_08695 [Lutimaribacter marinistellae]|uniref:DUF1488 family protein n=1 Tax=Lutimaribacter marinistellae TaxID=1820329 RepID=A0ABV7TE17_9RHOB
MQITGIEIIDTRFCTASGRHRASLRLTLPDRVVTLFCALALPEAVSPALRDRAMMADALRQMRRMPEFRSGRMALNMAAPVQAMVEGPRAA